MINILKHHESFSVDEGIISKIVFLIKVHYRSEECKRSFLLNPSHSIPKTTPILILIPFLHAKWDLEYGLGFLSKRGKF